MPKIPEKLHTAKKQRLSTFRSERYPWWTLWRDLATYYLPRRYIWLESSREQHVRELRNASILDGTATSAGKVLASGMMNGITSPARIWFKLRVNGFDLNEHHTVRVWLEEVERRMRAVMAESNFYNALAVMYLDLVFFGTATVLIYEDAEDVIRCYNPALGEYYLGQDARLQVNTFAREFKLKAHQIAGFWPDQRYWSSRMKNAMLRGDGKIDTDIDICHLIEPRDNTTGHPRLPDGFKFREMYWEKGGELGTLLAFRGYNEFPGLCPRWELTATDAYGGGCPGMDALGDTIQLQHETKRKGQGLDKIVSPPMVADVQLQHKPTALLPNGITFVSGNSQVGMSPAYQVNMPLQELTADIREIQSRIREIFHNDLFQMISQLDTVRSATEIDARREERLVQLGPVLERFENEALDPAINRIYSIMDRAGLIPEAPPEIEGQEIEIQYVSILSNAQSAVGVASVERLMQFTGNLAAVDPSVLNILNFDEIVRNYARDVGTPASNLRTRQETDAMAAEQQRQAQEQQALEQAQVGADTAKVLSETDVGGGANALQEILG